MKPNMTPISWPMLGGGTKPALGLDILTGLTVLQLNLKKCRVYWGLVVRFASEGYREVYDKYLGDEDQPLTSLAAGGEILERSTINDRVSALSSYFHTLLSLLSII
jgi:hypothetical protein